MIIVFPLNFLMEEKNNSGVGGGMKLLIVLVCTKEGKEKENEFVFASL